MEFAIVDIETTGSQYAPDSITEIGIVITDGKRVLDTYETLINPQSRISKFVQHLTGINEEMVADAPVFSDVASEILSYLEGRVFVAHNVNFDYKIVKQHFDNIGITMPTKRLCTIRLSRAILPDLPSYGLGKISVCLGLKHQNAHRAMGDAQVTAELFHILFDKDETEIHNALKSNSKESTLPANLNKQTFEDLPNSAGVYYFYNAKGKNNLYW
jgi:DNA polymerase III subunit epsilon